MINQNGKKSDLKHVRLIEVRNETTLFTTVRIFQYIDLSSTHAHTKVSFSDAERIIGKDQRANVKIKKVVLDCFKQIV